MRKFYFLTLAIGCLTWANGQIINFPDAKFKAKLLASTANTNPAYYYIAADINQVDMVVDTNNNGEIEVSEAQGVYYLTVQGTTGGNDGPDDLTDLTGIEYFTNLIELNCADNVLTSLDVSALTNMTYFRCDRNNISSLNIDGLINLDYFAYGSNNLPNLEISHLINLRELHCGVNGIINLDVTPLTNLEVLVCYYNQIASLDLTQNQNMRVLFCEHNQLTFLDISNFKTYNSLHANDNIGLQTVIMKFGILLNYQNMTTYNMNLQNCPSLQYICVDDVNVAAVQQKMDDDYNYPLCHVNSYCSFTPGGTYNHVQGITKFDSNNNGCDAVDQTIPNLYLAVNNGAVSINFVADLSGNYSLPIQNGSYTITPTLENPQYYNITPNSLNVSFPSFASPYQQDFCIVPNGVHPDVEVIIVPLDAARPGFNSAYKIIYRNKGNTTLSGNLSFVFPDDRMDLISVSPSALTQTFNELGWTYTNLQPVETREIAIVLNSNAPTDIPPVIIGDQLDFEATITPIVADETPQDNVTGLKQIVVGSFDPNDKTCLQGIAIIPEMVGDYVHYVIRFENTGTYPAENIVVKDMIDLSKFDIATLIPLSASHSFETRITSGNKVEFIFENIQLPFDDANNDGYVAFKIKTKPTLVVGDTFANSAGIYFDYNFPIVTNTATTMITALANPDFEFSDYFTLYPNPAKSELNIKASNSVEMKSINIYNLLGQLILAIPNAQSVLAIDVSDLKSGNYFIKVNSDKGSSSGKFVKQ